MSVPLGRSARAGRVGARMEVLLGLGVQREEARDRGGPTRSFAAAMGQGSHARRIRSSPAGDAVRGAPVLPRCPFRARSGCSSARRVVDSHRDRTITCSPPDPEGRSAVRSEKRSHLWNHPLHHLLLVVAAIAASALMMALVPAAYASTYER